MKKLLFVFVAAALAVSCGGRDYYFAEAQSYAYNDPEAEFDTLSYAVGMNLGLNVSLNYGEAGMTIEPLKEAFNAEINKRDVDQDFLEANREVLNTFSTERMRPYAMAKRMAMFTKDTTKKELPALFDEEYSAERIATALGHDMAQYIRNTMSKVNLHYLFQAMDDAMKVESQAVIDDYMQISTMQLRDVMQSYYGKELPAEINNFSKEWLRGISKKGDVEMFAVGADTLYYRVENPGSELRPTNDYDTISFRYEGYTCRGVLFESTAKRAADVRKQIAKMQADTTMSEDKRAERLAKLEEQALKAEQPTIPLSQFRVPGAIEAMKKIGAGGEITVWMPAELAYGARGNRAVLPNEAIVMHIELKDVKPGVEIPKPAIKPLKPVEVKEPKVMQLK
ncbi:MAG: FKBP-type peptidyl-prolyl cis-trans isomerase [Alistipes sp.]|nr:FKBP-type peptidyl-prolyl cis-trans isomerase [Alistipes sp.]